MKIVRFFLLFFILMILLVVLAIGWLVFFVDPNQFKPTLTKEVLQRTGYRLVMEGNLSWSFYPQIGVKTEHLILFTPAQPTTSPLIDAKQTTIAMNLWPLLRGEKKLQGHVYIGNLQLMKIQAQNVHVGLHFQNDLLILEPVTAALYTGQLEGKVHARTLSATPQWDWDVKLTHIQIKPLLRDVNGSNAKLNIAGVADFNLQATTVGKAKQQILQNLNGASQFSLKDGVLEGVDLNYLVKSANALINQEPQNFLSGGGSNSTSFSSLTGTMLIKNGIAENNDLRLQSSAFTAKGQGSFNLIAQVIHYRLQVEPQPSGKTRWLIPVLISGDIDHPSVRLDRAALAKAITQQQIEKVKTKALDQIQKHIPGKAGEFLQNLLGK